MLPILLRPFSSIYALVTGFRNYLYDKGLKGVLRPVQLTISVGNLTVGGTGKTPMIEYLVTRLAAAHRLAILSRGYGRRTRGYRLATPADTAQTIGDEPMQLYRKFGGYPPPAPLICVDERRGNALNQLRREQPQVDLILLDDAFQHRSVRPYLNLLLTDYNRPFYMDHPFPEGRLRESRRGAKRADAVLVTKCPDDLLAAEQATVTELTRPYVQADTPIFFTGLHYSQPVSFATHQAAVDIPAVVLVSGLANANVLEQYVRQTFRLIRHERFADHYAYTRADYDRLRAGLPPGAALLTTEKDWVKLDALLTNAERATDPLYYLPITVRFLAGEDAFRAMVEQAADGFVKKD